MSVCLVRCCRFKLFCHQYLKSLIHKIPETILIQMFSVLQFVRGLRLIVHILACVQMYMIRVCAYVREKKGKEEDSVLLLFPATLFQLPAVRGGCGQPTQSITEYYSVVFLKIPFTTRKKHFSFSVKFQVHFLLYTSVFLPLHFQINYPFQH